ncbi:MAG: McrBC 5-methylcytosine restriction system component [halophilic archaeon J07HB67]|jgi:McrBC 5-methylcytosine restriction system component.|nr:MAG: McrBC 5-methylcytosine restriction system component [halophilic archaeon J07HB67]
MSESPADVTLTEHDESDPIELRPDEESVLTDLTVADTNRSCFGVTYDADGLARIGSNSVIGTVRLPSGRRVTVTPKDTIGRLLSLLAYADDTPAVTLNETADLEDGATFHRVLAALFETELQTVLRNGLAASYTDRSGVRDHLRGRLDVHRQIQRSTVGPPTAFAVDYRTTTTQTTLNRAVAVAARRLQELLADERRGVTDGAADGITRRLRRSAREWRDRLDGPVPETVSLRAVDRIELSRLTDHYAALLALTRTVLSASFFDDLRPGDRRGRALFVDANDVVRACARTGGAGGCGGPAVRCRPTGTRSGTRSGATRRRRGSAGCRRSTDDRHRQPALGACGRGPRRQVEAGRRNQTERETGGELLSHTRRTWRARVSRHRQSRRRLVDGRR